MSARETRPKIRVMVADDHAVLRTGLRYIIGAEPDLEVVAEAADGLEALRCARETRPDVAVLDLSMPGPGGARTIASIARECPDTRVLVLTVHQDPSYMAASLAAGATGFLVKRAPAAELVAAIRSVRDGHASVSLATPGRGTGAPGPAARPEAPHHALSRRERQVLALLARGHTNSEIASSLAVSVKTIETYRGRLSEKLGLRGRAQLFRFASESGLLEADDDDSAGSDA